MKEDNDYEKEIEANTKKEILKSIYKIIHTL